MMKDDPLKDLRIASPCHVGWQNMSGDDRVRFCRQCDLHVYNISEMTRDEALALIAKREGGRICARLHRRADGTVITRDCPVGLRAWRRRVARRAGVVLTAVLGITANLFGQSRSQKKTTCLDPSVVKIEQHQSPRRPSLTGVLVDQNGEVIPGAKLNLTNKASKEKRTVETNDSGEFRFADLQSGDYRLEISSADFAKVVLTRLVVKEGESQRLDWQLHLSGVTELIGIVSETDIGIYNSNGLTIGEDLLHRLPH